MQIWRQSAMKRKNLHKGLNMCGGRLNDLRNVKKKMRTIAVRWHFLHRGTMSRENWKKQFRPIQKHCGRFWRILGRMSLMQ